MTQRNYYKIKEKQQNLKTLKMVIVSGSVIKKVNYSGTLRRNSWSGIIVNDSNLILNNTIFDYREERYYFLKFNIFFKYFIRIISLKFRRKKMENKEYCLCVCMLNLHLLIN